MYHVVIYIHIYMSGGPLAPRLIYIYICIYRYMYTRIYVYVYSGVERSERHRREAKLHPFLFSAPIQETTDHLSRAAVAVDAIANGNSLTGHTWTTLSIGFRYIALA